VLAKSVDKATVAPGGELIYTIHVRNLGNALAQTIIVIDTVPLNTSYVAGSLRIGDATTTYATATVLTDATDADQGQLSSGNPIFSIPSLQPDDSQANQGLDEKKVYFKVLVP
jgi:uncharacterized repeat protein (TIGR01451 family)